MITSRISWSLGSTPHKSPIPFASFGPLIRRRSPGDLRLLPCPGDRPGESVPVPSKALSLLSPDFTKTRFSLHSRSEGRYQITSDNCRSAFIQNRTYHLDLSMVPRFSIHRSKNHFQITTIPFACPRGPAPPPAASSSRPRRSVQALQRPAPGLFEFRFRQLGLARFLLDMKPPSALNFSVPR